MRVAILVTLTLLQLCARILRKQSYLWSALNFLLNFGCPTGRLSGPSDCRAEDRAKSQHTETKILARAMPATSYLPMLGSLRLAGCVFMPSLGSAVSQCHDTSRATLVTPASSRVFQSALTTGWSAWTHRWFLSLKMACICKTSVLLQHLLQMKP